jgi:predicted ATPase
MLPRTPTLPGLEVHAHYAPCDQVGGDFYDLVQVGDQRIAVVIGDVAGHGLDAALVMASAKKSIQVHSQRADSPRSVMTTVAEDLAPELPRGVFFTACHCVLDLATGTARMVRAGHSPVLRYRSEHRRVEQYLPAGMPVGAAPPAMFNDKLEELEIQLEPGDTLVFFTDGLSEAMNAQREEYGEERLVRLLTDSGTAPPNSIAAQMLTDVSLFQGDVPSADDVTLVVLRYTGTPAASARAPAGRVPGNLPAPGDRFVGRLQEQADLAAAITGDDSNLVTITGPGGSGKTRLAVEVARSLRDRFPGGCWFADCTGAHEIDQVAYAAGRAFGLPLTSSEDTAEAVAAMLANRPPLVLVCDNFEHVAEHAAGLLAAWRRAAPHVRFVITSRIPCRVPGEQEFPLAPLAVPPGHRRVSPSEAVRFESVQLFLERGRTARPGFDLDSENAPAVATIVRALDGMPLALELAAARLAVCTPAELVQLLDRKFDVLESSRDGLPERSRSLLGAIELSYEQLTPAERAAFEQLAIFSGGFSFEAATAIVDLQGVAGAPPLIDVLQGLREKSLLNVITTGRATRFHQYQTLIEFAARKWEAHAAPGAHRALLGRFVQHVVEYAETWNRRLKGPAAFDALDRLSAETDNVFTAFDRALDIDEPVLAARAILALSETMAVRGPAAERASRLERARAALANLASGPTVRELRAELTIALAAARFDVGDWDRAADDAAMAVLAADAIGTPELRARALMQEAQGRLQRADYADAATLLEAAHRALGDADAPSIRAAIHFSRAIPPLLQGMTEVAVATLDAAAPHIQAVADPRQLGRLAAGRGIAFAQLGEWERALEAYDEAEQIAFDLGNLADLGRFLGNRGNVLRKTGDLEGALTAFRQAEHIARELRDTAEVARHIANRGAVFAAQDRHEVAIKCFDEAIGHQREMGSRRAEAIALDERATSYLALGRAEEARRDALRALELWDASSAPAPRYRFIIRAHLAAAEWAVGEPNEARRHAATALEIAEAEGITDDHPDPDLANAWRELQTLMDRTRPA